MTKTYKSDPLTSLHRMMEDLHEAGAIDKQTMRHFDEGCLTPIHEFTPDICRAPASCKSSIMRWSEVSGSLFIRLGHRSVPP